MSLSTKKMNCSLHDKKEKNITNNPNIPNGKYLFSSSFYQPKKPNTNTASKNKNIKKSVTTNEIFPQHIVNKNSIRQNRYSKICEIKNNVIFQNFFRSSSTSRIKIGTENNTKHSSNINKNKNIKKSNESKNNVINAFKNNNIKPKNNNRNNSNSIKRTTKLNLNNLCNPEEFKHIFSNATKKKKLSPSNTKQNVPLQTEYKKTGSSYENNKSNNNMFLSHNQIYILGNLFTSNNSIYNNTDNNVINKKNFRNDIMKKYYNSKIHKDVNSINFPDFQLPVKPSVSPNNIIQIQNYFNNLYKKSHNNKNINNNYISSESNKINKAKKRENKKTKKKNNTNNSNDIKNYNKEIKNLVNNYVNKNNSALKRDLQNSKERNRSSANNINENNKNNRKIESEDKYEGPEEMHYYYVNSIQKGKLIEKKTCF